jgi:type IV pilus assembly protein PilQ
MILLKILKLPRSLWAAIIKGIFQATERDNEVKVPLLGDIPLIGHLFRHKSKLADKTELLVLLTPTALDKH